MHSGKLMSLLRGVARRNGDFFRVRIESVGPERSFFQTFWTRAADPSEAIDSVHGACRRLGMKDSIVSELDYADVSSMPEDSVYEKKSNVFYAPQRHLFPTEKSFIAPIGIIGSSEGGEHDYELIQEGFSLTKVENIYELEAVLDRSSLFNTFLELIKKLPSIKVFWIRIAADWENRRREEFWTNEDLNTIESITNFLSTRMDDTVENGHVALTVYSSVGETNLSIDTHKTIEGLTKSEEMQQRMADGLRELGFSELTKLYSLRYDYHHWHYRPAQAKSRTKLVRALKRCGFTLWREHEVEPTG